VASRSAVTVSYRGRRRFADRRVTERGELFDGRFQVRSRRDVGWGVFMFGGRIARGFGDRAGCIGKGCGGGGVLVGGVVVGDGIVGDAAGSDRVCGAGWERGDPGDVWR
jgi:hypothetical protein